MRFHVKTRPEHVSWEWMRDTWIAADGIPLFESAWHWDHFYPLTGDLDGPNLEGWTTLAALAQATSRIRVGCQVTVARVRKASRSNSRPSTTSRRCSAARTTSPWAR